jgi:hypothetical protein
MIGDRLGNRVIRVDGDRGAYEDQIAATMAEARRVNPPQLQRLFEQLATSLRADIERDWPDIRDHRALLTEVLGRVNALQLDLFPETMQAMSVAQTVFTLALYGQPGD